LVLAGVDSVLTDGVERAKLYRVQWDATEAKRAANIPAQFEVQALEMESRFEKLCYQLVKANARLNGSSLTIEQLQSMSVYSFYTLKSQLLADRNN
jgi:hypothetical protein